MPPTGAPVLPLPPSRAARDAPTGADRRRRYRAQREFDRIQRSPWPGRSRTCVRAGGSGSCGGTSAGRTSGSATGARCSARSGSRISMAVTAIALGILYAGLFGNPLEEQLPYILVGFIVWGFISGCISEGSDVFIANVGLIHAPARAVRACTSTGWCGGRSLFFAAQPRRLRWSCCWSSRSRWAGPPCWRSPRSACWSLNGAWVALLFGIVTTRFRDLTADHPEPRAAAVLPDADRLDLRGPAEQPQPEHRRAGPARGAQPPPALRRDHAAADAGRSRSSCGTGWSSAVITVVGLGWRPWSSCGATARAWRTGCEGPDDHDLDQHRGQHRDGRTHASTSRSSTPRAGR